MYKDGFFSENIETPKTEKNYSTFKGTGWHTLYRLDMQIDKKGYFETGKLIKGESYEYDENDNLLQIKVYENGKIIKVNSVND